MIKRLFSGQINSITTAALLVALSSLVSRFLGMFRDRILAGQFGAGDTLDVYYAAFRIPDLIFNLLVLGALSAGFIPIFISLAKNLDGDHRLAIFRSSNKEAWDMVANLLNIIFIALLFLCGLGILVAPWLMKLVTPGFSPEKLELTVKLSRIMFLSPIFLGISSVLGGVLQSFKRFFVYSLSPIFYNLGIIFGALFFVPRFGIIGLAWGVVLGAFFHMLAQIPTFLSLGFRYVPKINLKDGNIRKIFIMMVPRTMSLAISQINLLIMTIFASSLVGGSLAIFNFANNLQFFPVSIFGISFAVAAFPVFSKAAFDKKKLVASFSQVFRQIQFFIVPASILLFMLRAQIIRVVLGSGNFDWNDTTLTMNTLAFFIISFFAQATLPLLTRMNYARHNARTPFLIGLFSATINVGLAYYFRQRYGVAGLALAFSTDSIINFALLWFWLRRELGFMDGKKIIHSLSKFLLAGLASALATQGMKLLINPYVDMNRFWGVFSQGLFAGGVGIMVYLAFCSLLKSEEFFSFWNSIKRRINWKKVEAGDQGEARGI